MSRTVKALLCGALFSSFTAQSAPDPLAEAFGSMPSMYGAQLSPDGRHISYLSLDAGLPVLYVTDTAGNRAPVMASEREEDGYEISWCDWANEERLLCGFGVHKPFRSAVIGSSRLVAINHDGSQPRELAGGSVTDWLPDDAKNILIQAYDSAGVGIRRLNIYNGKTKTVERGRRAVSRWLSDGHGEIRLRFRINDKRVRWEYRQLGGDDWQRLREYEARGPSDRDVFIPLGFGENRDELLALMMFEGRRALFAKDLRDDAQFRVIHTHEQVDLQGLLRVGKYNRIVGIGYVTDVPRVHYFDSAVADIVRRVAAAKPGASVDVIDESWDRNFYLLYIAPLNGSGRYYRLDLAAKQLAEFWSVLPQLDDHTLAEVKPLSYPAKDGVEVPAYLTLPTDHPSRKLPAVILPHGGPSSRDYMSFDFLSQFLAARGFAVLQANYRGSSGYGREWLGDGAWKGWQIAIQDVIDGARYLVDEGIADPERICAVGWSYGGYAALMSALEAPEQFRCIVSVAGVTNPVKMSKDSRSRWVKEFIGDDFKAMESGSPWHRADELNVPVLLFHGDRDANVRLQQSTDLKRKLKRQKKTVELIVYEGGDHSLSRSKYRIDLLDKMGSFLDEQTASSTRSMASGEVTH